MPQLIDSPIVSSIKFSLMKNILFLFVAFSAATLFTSCAKEESVTTAPAPTPTNVTPATDRATPCTVVVVSNGPVTICGLYQNSDACESCCGIPLVGYSAITSLSGGTIGFTGYADHPFYVKNTGTTTITVSVNGLVFNLRPGQCSGGSLHSDCSVSYVLPHC